LEVVELTGGFASVLPEPRYAFANVAQMGLWMERPEMDLRIDSRVGRMWRDGLVGEVEGLLGRGLRQGRTASRALGYRQVIDFIDGEISEEQAKEQTRAATRRFARKQLGWFRRDGRIEWLDAAAPPERLASELASVVFERL
jgi:tRNA dimethylallyltransferase